MDVYLSGRANLVVAMPSGPEALAHVQGRPCVMVNELPAQKGDHNSDDLILYRPVFRAGTEERLTYREMLQQRIPGFGSQRNFEERGWMVGENAPEELLSAVKEHLAR